MADNESNLSEQEIRQNHKALQAGWELKDGALKREFKLQDFASALDLANQIGRLAEAQDHHPKMVIEWGKLTIFLTTHSADGLTSKDFELAKLVDGLT